jgi:hypothetical protein
MYGPFSSCGLLARRLICGQMFEIAFGYRLVLAFVLSRFGFDAVQVLFSALHILFSFGGTPWRD